MAKKKVQEVEKLSPEQEVDKVLTELEITGNAAGHVKRYLRHVGSL